MPTPSRHFKEELQDLLDGRLDAATREEVEQHLETCAQCRREYDVLRWTKQVAARRFAAQAAPDELRANILRALRAEEAPTNVVAPPREFWSTRRRPLFAAAALLIAAAILAGIYSLRPVPLPETVAKNYLAYQSGTFPMQRTTSDVDKMEAFFKQQGVPFHARAFDLGKMDYRLVGGRVQALRRQPGAVTVYRGADGQILLCHMFLGQVPSLPSETVVRENKGVRFHIYETKGLTLVFWQEGKVACVLASDLATKEVTRLAFAKAESP